MKNNLYIAIIITSLISIACKETVDIYLGVPLQPNISENNYIPGLNIIGVIRPDFNDSISKSFVHVQEVAPAINNYPEFTADSLIVKNASVLIADTLGLITEFKYTHHDSLFAQKQYRPNSLFKPIAGMRYDITCSYNDLPVLNSATLLPNVPEIVENTISIHDNNLSFEMAADTTIFLFEIYVFQEETKAGYARIVSNLMNTTPIEVELNTIDFDRIEVYGFDYNLTSYYINSNTSLNFNKYRQPFGNVENGYGVFGSLNFVLHTVN